MPLAGRRAQRAVRSVLVIACSQAFLAAKARPAAAVPNDGGGPSSPEIALEWSGPGPERTCLGAERLAAAVEEYLERPAFVQGAAPVTLHVQVEQRDDGGWRARLRLRENGTGAVLGERVLTSDYELCSALDEPLELAVALMVDNEIVPTERKPEPPPPEPEPEPAPPVAQRTEKPKAPVRYFGEALAVAHFGLLPRGGVGLELAFGAAPLDWLVLRAAIRGTAPQSSAVGSARISTSLVLGELAVCPTLRLGATWLSACGGADGGAYLFDARGLAGKTPPSRALGAGFVGARATWQLGRHVGLLGAVSGLFPDHPDRFVYDLDGQRKALFRTASPSLVAGVGCSAIF